jgi:hypothetical protein
MREALAQRPGRRIELGIGGGNRAKLKLGDLLFFLLAVITREGLELLFGFATSLAGGHCEELGS